MYSEGGNGEDGEGGRCYQTRITRPSDTAGTVDLWEREIGEKRIVKEREIRKVIKKKHAQNHIGTSTRMEIYQDIHGGMGNVEKYSWYR